MASNIKNIRKLQTAINSKTDGEYKILYQTSQFYSAKQDRPVTKYHIRKSWFNEYTEKTESEEIFSTYSQLQIILFLRDFWFIMNGEEVPTDNQMWEEVKLKNNIDYEDIIK